MEQQGLLPKLFRTQYRKMVSVLCAHFGIRHIEIAEDLVSETFLAATESWPINGVPDNPEAWLYTVARNKARNHFTRTAIYDQKVAPELRYRAGQGGSEAEIDLSEKNIGDSQLAMIFAVCDPVNNDEAQIALALNILCGFGAGEIADAFLTNREVVYKRLSRAKEKLKEKDSLTAHPSPEQVEQRLDNVLKTIYLLFSEGYYSSSQDKLLRRDLCGEAMRLCHQLLQHQATNLPAVNALMALMWFHSSRFDARMGENGEAVLFEDQDRSRWNTEYITNGMRYLSQSASGSHISKYHIEAAIAYWHTREQESEKWENILLLYGKLLQLDYSPLADLNRIYALSRVMGKEPAINQALALQLTDNHLYHSLLGNLYTGIDTSRALEHYRRALGMVRTAAEKRLLTANIDKLRASEPSR